MNSNFNYSSVEVIRHSDPATFQEFQSQLSAMAAAAGRQLPAAPAATASSAEQLLNKKRGAHVRITEQPASKGLRFRYECEGRSAGSIPGEKSTNEQKTYPAIQVSEDSG